MDFTAIGTQADPCRTRFRILVVQLKHLVPDAASPAAQSQPRDRSTVPIKQRLIWTACTVVPGAGRDPWLAWIPAFAGMTRRRVDAVPSSDFVHQR